MIRILLVDDYYPSRSQNTESLRHYGHLVSEFPSAEEAYLSLTERQYQVAVIDASVDCPVRGNRTLAEILKEEFPSVQRIAVTAEPSGRSDPLLRANFHQIMINPGIRELLKAINNPIGGEQK